MRLKRYLKKLYIAYFGSIYRKQYAYKLKINHFPNKPCEGEEKWGGYWRSLGVDPLKETYRVFFHYMGADQRILPETTCHYVIEPILNPIKMEGYYADKNFFEKTLPDGFCPVALLRKIQGHYYGGDYCRLEMDAEQIESILGGTSCRKLIVKPSVDSCSGNGVELFCKGKDGRYHHHQTGETLSYAWLENHAGHDFVLQEAVEQSDFISQFCDTAINTLRIAVYRSVKDDECHVLSTIMRIGGKGSYLDNAHAGGKFVGISQDGELGKFVCDQYGVKQSTFNDIDFANNTFVIPDFDRVKDFALEVGRRVAHHRLLALDVAIKRDGSPVLIEYNINGFSMWLFQFAGMPALGEYTEEIKEYCEKHQNDNTFAIYL